MQPKQINDVVDLSCNEELTFDDTISSSINDRNFRTPSPDPNSSSINDRDFRTPSPDPNSQFNVVIKKLEKGARSKDTNSTQVIDLSSANPSSSVVNPSSSTVIQAQRNSKLLSPGVK